VVEGREIKSLTEDEDQGSELASTAHDRFVVASRTGVHIGSGDPVEIAWKEERA
jgi:hypothetical protein